MLHLIKVPEVIWFPTLGLTLKLLVTEESNRYRQHETFQFPGVTHTTAKEPVPAVSAVSPAGGMTITSLESVLLSSCQPRTTDPLQLL